MFENEPNGNYEGNMCIYISTFCILIAMVKIFKNLITKNTLNLSNLEMSKVHPRKKPLISLTLDRVSNVKE